MTDGTSPPLRFSRHAVQRMLDFRLSVTDVRAVLENGETIEEYDDSSRLVLGRAGTDPVHSVVQGKSGVLFVITVYRPDPERWDAAFRHRIAP